MTEPPATEPPATEPPDPEPPAAASQPTPRSTRIVPVEERRRLTYEEKVIRAFIRDDRLASIPAQQKKRLVVLQYLIERCFPEDRSYPEKEVNQRLALMHQDVAALRRYLVESGLMTRAAGEYRRT